MCLIISQGKRSDCSICWAFFMPVYKQRLPLRKLLNALRGGSSTVDSVNGNRFYFAKF